MDNRRRKYFINKRYQGRFIAVFVGVPAVGIAVAIAAMSHYINAAIEDNMFRSHIRAASTGEIILPVAVKVGLVLFVLGVFVIGMLALYYSMKAGRVVEGMLNAVRRLGAGSLDFEVNIGQGHEFPGLERSFREMLAANRERVEGIKKAASELDDMVRSIESLGEGGLKDGTAQVTELNVRALNLEKAVGAYTLGRRDG